MTTDLHLNKSCVVPVVPMRNERVKKMGIKARSRLLTAANSFRHLNKAVHHQTEGDDAHSPKDKRESLKFCAKNFCNKWSEDLEKHYKIGELLGEGAYGNVYACTCLQSGAERAVKVILKSSDEKQNRNVIQEFEVLKELDHPNVLKNYGLFETDTHFYIVTDWIRGGELYDLLETEFTEEEVRSLMKSLLSCMNYCHQQKIVHRDLKPENVLLEKARDFSQIKVIDFGLAQFFQEGEGDFTEGAGSSFYMSPQVIQGQYGCKCDIWSCGVIAFVCLGGYAPWSGEDDMETAQLILDADQVYFDDPVWDEFSESALDFIEYLLTFDEKERPTAAQALQHEWLQASTTRLSSSEKSQMDESARDSLQCLKKFQAADSKLKQCTYSLIASQIVRKEDKEEVDRMFQMLDVDCDGKISVGDMTAIYNDQFGIDLSPDDVAAIIYEVNLSGSGSITYSEFVIASLNEKGLLVSEPNLERAFQILDQSGTGFLTAQDLTLALNVSEEMEDYVSRRIIAPADKDGDGKISLDDFKAYFDESLEDHSTTTAAQLRKTRRRSSTASRRSSGRRRSSTRMSFRSSAVLSELPTLGDDNDNDEVEEAPVVVHKEPNFRALLSKFEGQCKSNAASVPSMFQQTCR